MDAGTSRVLVYARSDTMPSRPSIAIYVWYTIRHILRLIGASTQCPLTPSGVASTEGARVTNAQKYLLAALAAAPDGALSPVQAQKALFVLGQEAPSHVGAEFYQFVPYNYGPFCRTIYDDVAAFASQGLLTVDNSSRPARYILTKTGLEAASAADIAQPVGDYLRSVVGWVAGQSFSQLLNSVYAKYPDFAVNSVFSR